MKLLFGLLLLFFSNQVFCQQFIGVNVDTPSVDLDIRTLDTNDGSEINLGNSDNSFFARLFSGRDDVPFAALYRRTNQPFIIGTAEQDGGNFQQQIVIDSFGRIGMGTSSPFHELDVRSDDPDNGAIIRTANQDLSHHLSLFPGRTSDPNPFIQWADGDPLRFATDAGGFQEQMRLTSDGKLGLGTQSPNDLLHLFGNDHLAMRLEAPAYNDTTEIVLQNGSGGTYSNFHIYNTNDRLRIGVKSDFTSDVFEEIVLIQNNGTMTIDGNLQAEDLSGTGTRNVRATSTGFLTTGPEISYVSVSPLAFKAADSDVGWNGTHEYVQGVSGDDSSLYAPLSLPDGATITQFYVNYVDNSSTQNLTVRLRRKNTFLSSTTIHTHTSFGVPSVTSHTSPTLAHVVDNQNYVYYLEISCPEWSGGIGLYFARIKIQE